MTTRRRFPIGKVILAVIIALVLATIGNAIWRPFAPGIDPEAAQDPYATPATPTPPSASPSVAPSASANATPDSRPTVSKPSVRPKATMHPSEPKSAQPTTQTCARDIGAFVPAKLIVERLGVSVPVLAMPLNKDGTFPVPPFNGSVDPKRSATWWNGSAKPGAGKGVVHMDVHTYTAGGALGNLFGRHAKVGDVIKIADSKGRIGACYKVADIPTWGVATIPNRDVSRTTGPIELALEFCWESPNRWGDHVWRLRRYLIARPLE